MAHRSIPLVEPEVPDFASDNGHPHAHGLFSLDRWQLVWDQRWSVLRFAFKGLLFFVVLAFLIPTRYESITRLMPPESHNSAGMAMLAAVSGQAGEALSSYASNLLGMKSSGALFIGVLNSTTVEDALINRFDLRKVYWVSRWEDARKKLEARSYFAEDRKSGIIEIRVRDSSRERAQEMARAYVEELNRTVAHSSTSAARREREFLETRLKAVKVELDQAAEDFSQFASKNTAIDIPAQGKAMVEAAARLQGELIAAQAERQGLEQIYTANNVRVRAVQGKIDELRQQLDKLGAAGTGSDEPKSDDLYPSIRKLPLLGVTYADLYRRTKIQEAVFETLTKQYELAKVQEAKEIPTVRVLDPANYPERYASPPRVLIIVGGFFLSLIAACAWIMGRSAWDETDNQNPRKKFARKVGTELKHDQARMRGQISLIWSRWRRQPQPITPEQVPDR